MSDRPMPPIPKGLDLTQDQIDAIAGGECSPDLMNSITAQLKQSYDDVVDFTSYVIERVVNSVQ